MKELGEVSGAWFEVLSGIVLVGGMIILLNSIYSWYLYHNSIQKVIYSNFGEYFLRKRSIKGLSESYYFKSRFGEHRIYYQLAKDNRQNKPQAFLMIILSSGLYLINVKTQGGHIIAKLTGDYKSEVTEINKKTKSSSIRIVPFKNPKEELSQCKKMLEGKLGSCHIPIHLITVFPDKSSISWDGKKENIPVVQRKELFGAIDRLHKENPKNMTADQIQAVYRSVAADSIEYELNYCR